MSAADHTHNPVDALSELLAEEATSAWLPTTAGPAAAALPLSELSDTADLPRESMQTVEPAGRRGLRRRKPVGPAPAVESAAPPELQQLEDASDVVPSPPVEIQPHRRRSAEQDQIAAPRDEEPRGVVLPRGPRPGAAARHREAAPTVQIARGPRPAPRPAGAEEREPKLRVVVPVASPRVTVEHPRPLVAPIADPLAAMLEQLEQHEAVELQPELEAAATPQSGGDERRGRVARRPFAVALTVGVVAAAAAGFGLAGRDASTEAVPQLRAARLPDVAAIAVKPLDRRLAQERRDARAAELRANRRRAVAERRRREARQRAAARRRAATRRHQVRRVAVAPAPAVTSQPSVPVRVAPAPRISKPTPVKRRPIAPACNSDLGPC